MMGEIIALLTTAKQIGMDIGSMVQMVIMFFMVKRMFDKQFDKLILAINSLEKAHNERLSKIEAHVGIKKGE
jgi:hypothetical protein